MNTFIGIDTGFNENGNYTDKGIRQNTYIKLSAINSFKMNSTGKKLMIYTDCLGWILTQFGSAEEFIEHSQLNVLNGGK